MKYIEDLRLKFQEAKQQSSLVYLTNPRILLINNQQHFFFFEMPTTLKWFPIETPALVFTKELKQITLI